MKIQPTSIRSAARPTARSHRAGRHRLAQIAVVVSAFGAGGAAQAIDFGPNGMFSLTGFFEATTGRASNACIGGVGKNCDWAGLYALKHANWSDPVLPGQSFGTISTHFWQFQPTLGAKYQLPGGFKISGALSQRRRDGQVDVPGFWYDKSVTLSHEDYGIVQVGQFLTRSWNRADYPYGTELGVSSPWAQSGAGYGMLTQALRYTSRTFDVAEGNLVLEATYDRGNGGWTVHKPFFLEIWALYAKGPLVLEAFLQDTRNGGPVAWGHAPFTGLTPFPSDDKLLQPGTTTPLLGESSQSMQMLIGRYYYTPQIELTGGIRRNRWSGANAAFWPVTPDSPRGHNSFFNVDWNGTLNGVPNPGYSATSIDVLLGARYHMDKWSASTGLVHLGTASTSNPSERGQSNSTLINTFGLSYNYGQGLKFSGTVGFVKHARLGLAPMSSPDNSSFTKVDSRVSQNGNWFTVGFTYNF